MNDRSQEPLRWDVPSTAPIGRPTRIMVDDGRDLLGSGDEVIEFPPCDPYALKADAFARAVCSNERPAGDDDAAINMCVIDALFRSSRSGGWEHP